MYGFLWVWRNTYISTEWRYEQSDRESTLAPFVVGRKVEQDIPNLLLRGRYGNCGSNEERSARRFPRDVNCRHVSLAISYCRPRYTCSPWFKGLLKPDSVPLWLVSHARGPYYKDQSPETLVRIS